MPVQNPICKCGHYCHVGTCSYLTRAGTPCSCPGTPTGTSRIFDKEENWNEGLRTWRVDVERIERILAGPNCNLGTPYARRLIEAKRHLELQIAEVEKVRAVRRTAIGQAGDANTAKSSPEGQRERGPNKKKHRERVELEDVLISELAAVREQQNLACTLDELRKRFRDFRLWTVLAQTEQAELIEKEFKPKAYARILTARQFGVREETIKKSRQILKRQRPALSA